MNLWVICKFDIVHFPYYLMAIFTYYIIDEILLVLIFYTPELVSQSLTIKRGTFYLTFYLTFQNETLSGSYQKMKKTKL